MKYFFVVLLGTLFPVMACSGQVLDSETTEGFARDVALVRKHVPVLVLADQDSAARVLVAPTLQGRVLTSTPDGKNGPSFGWINFKLLASAHREPHINAYGGEDRIWLGPEGGQFGLFFAAKSPFDFAHWQTPAALDTEPFDIVKQRSDEVLFRKDLHLDNYSGTHFDLRIDREIRILGEEEVWRCLSLPPQKGVQVVAFESSNRLTNLGTALKKSTGLVSLWELGMFNASPRAMVVIPYRQGPESELGQVVESDYFGVVPQDRLKLSENVIYFRVDAHYRSKIGLSPRRALSTIGSYDAVRHVLTVIQFSPPERGADYVNSEWKLQDHPFAGSAVNSYNDGPNKAGDSLGNFYELESSSPALALNSQETARHFQRVIHLYGDIELLAPIAWKVLGATELGRFCVDKVARNPK